MKVNIGVIINMEGKSFKDLIRKIGFGIPGNTAIVVYFKDGNSTVLGKTNFLGGVCDDCRADFFLEQITGYREVTFMEE